MFVCSPKDKLLLKTLIVIVIIIIDIFHKNVLIKNKLASILKKPHLKGAAMRAISVN